MTVQEEIEKNLLSIERRISDACKKVGRNPKEITLVAVSKKQSLEKMRAFQTICQAKNRVVTFGENYVQEFGAKANELASGFEAHLIGPLQRNKAKDAVKIFDVIESVHSLALAEELDKAASKLGKQQKIMLQVNVSSDENKSGFSLDEARGFVTNERRRFKSLDLLGLMTITRLYENPELARPDFSSFRKFRDELSKNERLLLSMGMSDDFDIAIEEGADLVRIGTALFGSREN